MCLKPCIRALILIVCLAGAGPSPQPANAAEPVKIGILAFPSKPQALTKWQALAGVLKQAIPEHDFEVLALSIPELDAAVAAHQLDFVLTNSGHYVLLRSHGTLSAPLATLATDAAGQTLTTYGGVIFSRAGQARINSLRDIQGKIVAAVDIKSQGAYQMQAYELSLVGVLPQDVTLIRTGLPQSLVVEAVLAGRADVGFVRSGVLEALVQKGTLDIKQLRILNRQELPDFPFQVSTRLYPEWPFAALPQVDENLARHVAVVLFELEENPAATRAMGIHGFVVPADYIPVEDVLRELRLPPFDAAPRFTWPDVWTRYRWQAIGALLAGGVILLLGVSVLLMYRKLAASHQKIRKLNDELEEKVRARTRQLEESRALLSTVFDSVQNGIVLVDAETRRFRLSNTSFQRMLGYSAAEILELGVEDIHPQEEMENVNRHLERQIKQENSLAPSILVKRKDGSIFFADINTKVMMVKETSFLLAVFTDITARRQAELALKDQFHLLQVLLDAIPAPVFYKDPRGVYTGCNKAFEAYLGREKAQIVGKSVYDMAPKELAETYHQMDLTLLEEQGTQIYESAVVYADGTQHKVIFNKAAFNNKDGSLGGLVGVILDITEAKQAEEVLRFKNTVLSILQRISPSAILVVDENARIVSCNEQFIQMWGLPAEMVRAGIDEPVLRKVCAQIENPAAFLVRVKYLYEQKEETSRDELRLVDGRIIDRHSSPLADDDGRYYGRVWDFRDITELKRATEKIRRLNKSLEEKIRQLLAAQEELEQHRAHLEQEVAQRTARLTEAQRIAHLGNWEWDLINNTVNWSDEMYSIFGYAPQQIDASYKTFLNAVHPEDRQLVDDSARDSLKRQHKYNIEHRILQSDGTLRYVHGQAEVIKGEDGQPISMLGTYHDITERKLAEQTAIDERNFSNTLIASQPDIFYVLDSTGRFIRWNDKLRDVLGISDSRIAAANALDIIHEADRPSVAQKTQETFEQGTATNVARLITKTGIRVFSLTASRVDTAKGAYAVGVGTDITELKQKEEKIRNLNEELEDKVRERTQQLLAAQEELVRKEKLSLLGQVAGSVGHELRNPLAVMNNAVYFLKTMLAEADETTREYLEIIKTEIADADRIVSDLLDSARTRPPQPAAVSVRELIDQTLRRVHLPDTMTVSLDLPETLPPVRVDALQIQQVFRNLINNGLEAMPRGGALLIRALENRQDDTVTLSVCDSGSGMTPEVLARLFQPLFTTKARGIGLGLVVVKNQIEANAGTIRVESVPGEGSRFFVTLPRGEGDGS